MSECESYIISSASTIREAMTKINQLGKYDRYTILFVIDEHEKLIGSVTDGDIRRAFLNDFNMDSFIGDICKKTPIIAPKGMSDESMAQLIKINQIQKLPIVDEEGRIIGVKTGEFEDTEVNNEQVAVIMAGGEGMRLRPLTENVPKPMLKVGGKPILHIIVDSLKNFGFNKFIINIRYLGHIITEYFQDGSSLNVSIEYIEEPKPMGTAGSLGLISVNSRPTEPFLVVNGDLLTTLNFKAFRDFHIAAKYDLTLCGRPYEVQIPFGYPAIEGDIVTAFREKPTFTHLVNSGIYCLTPQLIDKVPVSEYFDMPDLIREAIKDKKRVGVFPLREEFHEIGRPESYKAAEHFFNKYFLKKDEKL